MQQPPHGTNISSQAPMSSNLPRSVPSGQPEHLPPWLVRNSRLPLSIFDAGRPELWTGSSPVVLPKSHATGHRRGEDGLPSNFNLNPKTFASSAIPPSQNPVGQLHQELNYWPNGGGPSRGSSQLGSTPRLSNDNIIRKLSCNKSQ